MVEQFAEGSTLHAPFGIALFERSKADREGHTSPMTRHPATFLLLLTGFLSFANPVQGQVNSNDYEVYVPPYMSLVQLMPDRTSNHPQTSANVVMGSSIWRSLTANPAGVTVKLTTAQPFQNLNVPSVQRDVRLAMPYVIGFGWTIDTALDATDYANGKLTASVEASSTSAGFAWIPLQVTFLTGDVNTLAGGTYELTVVGTITGN